MFEAGTGILRSRLWRSSEFRRPRRPGIVPRMGTTRHGRLLLSRVRAVIDAERVLNRHRDNPITIASLSHTVGVSERTLRNAFADVHRQSPKRYFLHQRLRAAYDALSDPGNVSATVTSVATDLGFYELGRFATQYRSLFGESPSLTLRRRRAQSPLRRTG
jgi:AraC-like DNA-binding protein